MSEATLYLFKAIGDLLTIGFILNFFFRLFRVDYYNPIVRSIVRLIDPPVNIVRALIKPLYAVDTASLLFAVLTQSFCFYLIFTEEIIDAEFSLLLLWSVYSIMIIMLEMLFWILLIGIIISWIAPFNAHPAIRLLVQMSEPIFKPFRIILPPMGGLDFSPIIAFIVLTYLQILLRDFAVGSGMPIGLSIGL